MTTTAAYYADLEARHPAGFVITRYDENRMRSVPVGKPHKTIAAAMRRLEALERSPRRYSLMIDLASAFGLAVSS